MNDTHYMNLYGGCTCPNKGILTANEDFTLWTCNSCKKVYTRPDIDILVFNNMIKWAFKKSRAVTGVITKITLGGIPFNPSP